MIIGRGIRVNNAYKYPLRWNWFTTLQSTQSYTVNFPGWYRFHVVGSGGRGGDGGNAKTKNNRTGLATSSGGSSASTGAYSVHEVYLRHGEVVVITMAGDRVVLVVQNVTVTAANGVVGDRGYDIENGNPNPRYASPVGAKDNSGVTATGGNVANFIGAKGVGSRGEPNWPESSIAGGNATFINDPRILYMPKYDYDKTTPASNKLLGGAGSGGDGVSTYSVSWKNGNPGYNGGLGGVILERGGYS